MDDDKKAIDDELRSLADGHEAEMQALASRQRAILARIAAVFDKKKADRLAGKLKDV